MNSTNAILIEVARVLSAATVVFGYDVSLHDLNGEARRRNATLETREEIQYLLAAIDEASQADLVMVVNICDNLADKLEQNCFSVVTGFGWLEDLSKSLTEPAKKLIGWTVAVVCAGIASMIVFTVPLSKLPVPEFWTFALGLFVMVGTASVTGAWAASINNSNQVKRIAVWLGYGFAVAYGYVLYRCDLAGFNFNNPVFGNKWLIVWMTVSPVAVPLLITFWESLPDDAGKPKTSDSYDQEAFIKSPYFNQHQEEMGKIDLTLDERIVE